MAYRNIRTCKWCGENYQDQSIVSLAPTWLTPIRTVFHLLGIVSRRYKYCSNRCYSQDPRNTKQEIVKVSKQVKEQEYSQTVVSSKPPVENLANLEKHQNQINQLKQLKKLLDEGVITQSEFDEQKKKILAA